MVQTPEQQRARARALIAQGLCRACGRKADDGKTMCSSCRKGRNSKSKVRRLGRILDGLCSTCGKKPRQADHLLCEGCQRKALKSNKQAQSKRRRANAEWQRDLRRDAREQVLDHYGRSCACCGETTSLFLTIDHVNDDGAAHRRSIGRFSLPMWIVENGFPEGFQILCYNCNCGRYRNGGVCPHKSGVPILEERAEGVIVRSADDEQAHKHD